MAGARTDLMDTRKTLKPVVIERPARNREMKTQDFGEVESKEGISLKKTRSEVFHEGYVGGQKYLVPDSNLEAMADMINLKMRRMENSKYVNQDRSRDNDTDPEEDYQRKRDIMFKKLDTLVDSEKNSEITDEEDKWSDGIWGIEEEQRDVLEELSTTSESEPEADEEEEDKKVEEDELEEIIKEGIEEEKFEVEEQGDAESEGLEEETHVEEGDFDNSLGKDYELMKVVEEAEKSEGCELAEPSLKEGADNVRGLASAKQDEDILDKAVGLIPAYYEDPNVKRFLISGHFRSDRKPIYIIQQYEGPSVFHGENPEFFSSKSEQDADVFVHGEFFKNSILEEDRYTQPVKLKTSPREVVIDWRSRVYEEKFTHVFVGSDFDIQLSGSFIEQQRSEVYTPLISIVLRKGTGVAAEATSPQGGEPAVCMMGPAVNNCFENKETGRQRRLEEARKRSVGFDEIFMEYPKGAVSSGPMAVYVSSPGSHADQRSPRHEARFERLSFPDGAGTSYSFPNALSETDRGRPGGLADPGAEYARRRQVWRSPQAEESPAEILEAFVRNEREKRRKRKKERERATIGSVLRRVFSKK